MVWHAESLNTPWHIDHTTGTERRDRAKVGKKTSLIAKRDCAAGRTEGYQLLCKACHLDKTIADKAAGRNGFSS